MERKYGRRFENPESGFLFFYCINMKTRTFVFNQGICTFLMASKFSFFHSVFCFLHCWKNVSTCPLSLSDLAFEHNKYESKPIFFNKTSDIKYRMVVPVQYILNTSVSFSLISTRRSLSSWGNDSSTFKIGKWIHSWDIDQEVFSFFLDWHLSYVLKNLQDITFDKCFCWLFIWGRFSNKTLPTSLIPLTFQSKSS